MTSVEEGMDKYAVVTDEPESKTASETATRICPICGAELDSGGACPTHGTKPFEPDGQ